MIANYMETNHECTKTISSLKNIVHVSVQSTKAVIKLYISVIESHAIPCFLLVASAVFQFRQHDLSLHNKDDF